MSNDFVGNNPGALAEGRAGGLFTEGMMKPLNVGESPFLTRVVVEEVIFDPLLIDEKRATHYREKVGLADIAFLRSLPPNTVIGKPVRDGTTNGSEKSQYYFPLFPSHMMMPIKAGEHVWVFYEHTKDARFGYWVCRITEARNIEDPNYTHADRKFDVTSTAGAKDKIDGNKTPPGFNNGPVRKVKGEAQGVSTGASYGGDEKSYENFLTKSDAAKVSDFEDVPRFRKRPGDFALQGSNNALIVLGTDRTGPSTVTEDDSTKGKVSSGRPKKDKKGKAGTIDMVVGRGQGKQTKAPIIQNTLNRDETDKTTASGKENESEGDPDFNEDLGRFYLSMKTDPDQNFNINLKGIPQENVGDGAPAGVIKVDHVRIVARKTIKFLVQPSFDSPDSDCSGIVIKQNGDIVFVPSDKGIIKLGGDDANKALLTFDQGAVNAGGTVSAPPMMSTMGGFLGMGGAHGIFATKILCK